jgi:hypothetical protein
MAILNVSVGARELDDSGWKSVLENTKRATADVYSRGFNKLSKERQAQGKSDQAAALALLSGICGFVLAPGGDDGPYAPVISGPSGRSALPEDLSPAELDVIEHVFSAINDDEFRSR